MYRGPLINKDQYRVAGLTQRLLAFAIDISIVFFALYFMLLASFVAMGLSAATLSESPFLTLLSFGMITVGFAFASLVVLHSYFLYYEVKQQQTPGKKVFGLKVISLSGESLTLEQCLQRELMRYLDVFMFAPGFISALRSEHNQRFGDRVAETAVVTEIETLENLGFHYMPNNHFQKMSELCPVAEIPPGQFDYFLEFAYRCMKNNGLDLLNSREALAWELEVRALIPNQDKYEIDRRTILAFFAETLHQRSLNSPNGANNEPKSAA